MSEVNGAVKSWMLKAVMCGLFWWNVGLDYKIVEVKFFLSFMGP